MAESGTSGLSQREIDALLASLGGDAPAEAGPAPEPAHRIVKAYDFRRPEKFSKENIRALRMVHESFARQLGTSLTARLRMNVQCRVVYSEVASFDEYLSTLPNPTVIYIVRMAPLPSRAIVQLDSEIAFAMIERQLGGTSTKPWRPAELSEIDELLLRRLGQQIITALKDTWSSVTPVDPELAELFFNPYFGQTALQNDVAVLILLEIQLPTIVNTLSIYLPYSLLAPVLDRLTSQSWFSGSGGTTHSERDGTSGGIQAGLQKVTVPVSVRLGQAELTVRELADLEVGDVLPLDTAVHGDLVLLVGDEERFRCRPGRVGKHLAVQITGVIAEGGGHDAP